MELKAMASILEAMTSLESKESQARVLNWVSSKLEIILVKTQNIGKPPVGSANSSDSTQTSIDISNYNSVADLLGEINVKTDAMRALVAAAYIQQKSENEDITSREVNQELTNIGHPSTNITRDFNNLMAKKPKLIIQTKKEGKTKQAQKKYKVTVEGYKVVQNLLDGQGEI